MASAQLVETSVTNNSPSQDSNHPDDHIQSRCNCILCIPFVKSLFSVDIMWRMPHTFGLPFGYERNGEIIFAQGFKCPSGITNVIQNIDIRPWARFNILLQSLNVSILVVPWDDHSRLGTVLVGCLRDARVKSRDNTTVFNHSRLQV